MTDDQLALDQEQLHALCEEANGLIKRLSGSVRRVSVRAGSYQVDVEWDSAPASTAFGPARASASASPPAAVEAVDGEPVVDERHAVRALLVGTFYRAPEPGSPPFVEVGDIVEAGQDVAIIEAMKVMNRIQADRPGRVAEILVADGEMVEFEQRLIALEHVDPIEG